MSISPSNATTNPMKNDSFVDGISTSLPSPIVPAVSAVNVVVPTIAVVGAVAADCSTAGRHTAATSRSPAFVNMNQKATSVGVTSPVIQTTHWIKKGMVVVLIEDTIEQLPPPAGFPHATEPVAAGFSDITSSITVVYRGSIESSALVDCLQDSFVTVDSLIAE